MSLTNITGYLVGRRIRQGAAPLSVVHNQVAGEPLGPAENAFVLVDAAHEPLRARYISWINLYDIENAQRREGGWEVIETAVPYNENVEWFPYGWGGESVPSVADVQGRSGAAVAN